MSTPTTLSRRSLLLASAGLLSGGLNQFANAQGRPPAGGMLRLIANENPYGPSPAARAAVEKAAAESWKYAMRETGALTKLIAEAEGVPANNIMISAGSSEALRVAALVYCRNGGGLVSALPTFSFLPSYARSLGAAVSEIPLDGNMRHDLSAMEAAITADTRLIYVCNPNNPTGTLLTGKELRAFIDATEQRAPVVVDEAYLDLWDDMPQHTAVSSVLDGKNVIVTRTFSKLHGMAGLRVGYAIAPTKIIQAMEALRITQMSYTGVVAATASLQDTEFLQFSRDRIHECLQITTDVLDELGLPYASSRGNFVYFDTGDSPRKFMGAMREAGILTGMSYAPYPTWARISMGKVEQMHVLAEALRKHFA